MAARASKKLSHSPEDDAFALSVMKSQNTELSKDLAECKSENAALKARIVAMQREQLENRYEWEKEYHNLSNIVINMESVLRKSLNKTTDLSNDFASLMSLCQIASSLKNNRASGNVGSVRAEPPVKDKAHVVNPHMVNGHILHVPTIRLTRVTDSQDVLPIPNNSNIDNTIDNDTSINDSVNENNNMSFQRRVSRQESLLNLPDISDLDEEGDSEELRNSRSTLSTIVEEEMETDQASAYENHAGVFSGVVDLKVYLNQITPEQMAYLHAPRVSEERNSYQCRPSMSERDRRELLPGSILSNSAGPSGLNHIGSRPESSGATAIGSDKRKHSASYAEDDSSDDERFSSHLSKIKVMNGLGLTLSSPLKEKNNLTPPSRTRRKLRISRNPSFENVSPSRQRKNSLAEFKDCESQRKITSPDSTEKNSKSPTKRRLFSSVEHINLEREEKKRKTDESPSSFSSSSEFVTRRRGSNKSLYVRVEQLSSKGKILPEQKVKDSSELRVTNEDRESRSSSENDSDHSFKSAGGPSTSKSNIVKKISPKKKTRNSFVSTLPRGRLRKLESPRHERKKSESDSLSPRNGRRNSGSLTPRERSKSKSGSKVITVKTKAYVSDKIQKRKSSSRKPSVSDISSHSSSDEDTSVFVSQKKTNYTKKSPPQRPVRSSRPTNLKEPSISKKLRRP